MDIMHLSSFVPLPPPTFANTEFTYLSCKSLHSYDTSRLKAVQRTEKTTITLNQGTVFVHAGL